MTFIDTLSRAQILNEPLPIAELLEDSFYYPSCGFDGGIVKFYGQEIQSFFYCDYATGREALMETMHDFHGYRVLANRDLRQSELVPNGWVMEYPPRMDMGRYMRSCERAKTPFAHWVVYERREDFDADFGPKRFSLVYIGGEGVATYQALYWSNRKTAKALAIIQPGHAFGNNWTNFTEPDGPLAWVVRENPYGTPDVIFYGGYLDKDHDLEWPGYTLTKNIKGYYRKDGDGEGFGRVGVWGRD